MPDELATDVHQHLWPPELVAALRARERPPRLRGWTLELDGEPDYEVDPADHDPLRRAEVNRADGIERALVSLSAPLGIESLPAAEAAPLLAAWHDGAARLPGAEFGAWAATGLDEPGPDDLRKRLADGFVGLQLPATALLDEASHDRVAGLLDALERADRPLMIHPGPARAPAGAPPWWPALVDYVGQMHAAWFAWAVHGRPRHPRLRVAFALLAGLAPLHGERVAARAGVGAIDTRDPHVFYETSSYGPEAIGAIARVVGADALVHGSDRPYATPARSGLDDVALRTVDVSRLLGTGSRRP